MPLLSFSSVTRLLPPIRLRFHLGAEIDGVGDEPFLVRHQIEDAGVAGVGAVVEDGDRPLHQMQARRVLQPHAEEWMHSLRRLVVDGDARRLDLLADDRQHRRLLPRQRHRMLDDVLEEVAEFLRLLQPTGAILIWRPRDGPNWNTPLLSFPPLKQTG